MDESMKKLITFRKRKIHNLVNELECCIGGQLLPILPYITNQQGKYSERKTISFVNQIVTGCEIINENQYDFYKSLFYCAIRVATTPYIIYENGNIFGLIENSDNIDTSFSDLIHFMHAEDCFIDENIHRYPINSLFATAMTKIYEVLSGTTSKNTSILFDSCIDFFEDELETENMFEEPDWSHMPEFATNPGKLGLSLEDEYEELQKSENLRLKKSFPSPVVYCKQFETLIDLFEQNYKFEIFNYHIQRMIDHFLTEQGLTLYSDEDAYITLCTYIKKTIKQGNEFQTKGDFIYGTRKR